ncbi:aminopeptidase [Caldalkalibacillus salinus]|uniref:aminopeptidase n=1 Tax=Caldalkalibacillus salinus TaxID=2803787 RepID=UPI0019236ACD|nr:aminopeptidase [Caldalkalibacillus salinus]
MSEFENTFETNLQKYAELAVKVGVNIQQGQTLVINAPIEASDFVHKVTKTAYQAGAKNVHVEWNDETLTLLKFQHAPDEAFTAFPTWKAKGFEEMAEDDAAFLTIHASNPDLLKEVDPKKVATANKTRAKAMYTFSTYIKSSKVSWSIVSVPTKDWAKKIFPDVSEKARIEKLWQSIFSITRVDQDDPVHAWHQHLETLKSKVEYMNDKKFAKLHYSGPGTDLSIELPQGHVWLGGGEKSQNGVFTVPNMPTEEIFTMPHKDGVNGTVKSTKPLNYSGNLIDEFQLTFKDGKVVDFDAEQGYNILKDLLDTDEGARRLGEVALVPHSSPISQSGLIFYNTLYDENASSHLALGATYPNCIEGGTKMDKEDLAQKGGNDSLIHVDFMMGSAEMNVDGETLDGQRIALMRNGEWVI